MENISGTAVNKDKVQLEISRDKLALLFESGLICAAEIHCLTAQSKKHVSDLCLSCCAKKMTCNITIFNNVEVDKPLKIKMHKS